MEVIKAPSGQYMLPKRPVIKNKNKKKIIEEWSLSTPILYLMWLMIKTIIKQESMATVILKSVLTFVSMLGRGEQTIDFSLALSNLQHS